jgi:hypothetical protein
MGCRFNFEMEGAAESYFLTSASVIFLSHISEPFPLIRAEWDHRGVVEERAESHAQPHWHVLTGLQNGGRDPSESAVQVFNPSVNAHGLERLHLAMATDWHNRAGNTHVQSIPDIQSLRNWVDKTARYSIDQISYALRRSGAISVVTEDFKP